MRSRYLIALFAVAVASTPAQSTFAACPGFTTVVNYPAGTSPNSVAAADFNGDSRTDLAFANSGSNDVSILLGNGGGTFAPAVNYAVGTSPFSVDFGDFNGDGKIDLAVANRDSNNVSILLGDGDGTFSTAVNYAVGTNPVYVHVPRRLPLRVIVANSGSNNVSVLRGIGDGTFVAAVNYTVGVAPVSLTLGPDFNFQGDGTPDLMVANSGSNDISVLQGNTDGTFGTALNSAVGNNPTSVALWLQSSGRSVSNFIAVTNNDSAGNGRVTIYSPSLFNGGLSKTENFHYDFPLNSDPVSVAAADLNGDGSVDLAVAKRNSGNVSIFFQNLGSFAGPPIDSAVGGQPAAVAVPVVNLDFATDVVTANSGSNNTSVLLSHCLLQPRGDFNRDLKSDVLWRNSSTGQNAMWWMNGVTIGTPMTIQAMSDMNWQIAGVGDFDGDGKVDVLWLNNATGEVRIWLMDDANTQSIKTVTTISSANWKIAAVAEFNGDGRSDVLWWNQVTGEVVVWLMTFTNGIFQTNSRNVITLTDLNWKVAGAGDFDGDGVEDVLWRNGSTGQDVVWRMNGGQITSAQFTSTVPDLNYKVAGIGDVNGDGKADVVWTHQATGDVVVWLMDGATLSSAGHVTSVSSSDWHAEGVGDFDGDGKADVIWRNVSTEDVVVWLLNGLTLRQAAYVATPNDLNWSIVAPR